ncbi:MAG: hypothetical protein ACRC2J_17405 [Microcoleaceae cyanobacterium]
MARYTGVFTVNVKLEIFPEVILGIVDYCDLEVLYNTGDYMMVREKPEQVSLQQLTTLEIKLEMATATANSVRFQVVAKNDELALTPDNHCRQIFDLITQLINRNSNWQVLDSLTF